MHRMLSRRFSWAALTLMLKLTGCGLLLGIEDFKEGSGGAMSGGTMSGNVLCMDQIRNGNETDVDCGGSCKPCADGRGCANGADCQSRICDQNKGACLKPTCNDTVQNGTETGIDCGGSCAALCPNGEGCTKNEECQSGVCDAKACVDYHVWSKGFGEIGFSIHTLPPLGLVATDSAQNIIFVASYFGKIDFGQGAYTSIQTMNLALAKFDTSGKLIFSKMFGIDKETMIYGLSMVVDSHDNILITGTYSGPVDFGGGKLPFKGIRDVFVVKFDSAGKHRFSKSFGTDDTQIGHSIAVDGNDNIHLLGDIGGTIEFGGKPISPPNSMFVVQLDPEGNHLWSTGFGDQKSIFGDANTLEFPHLTADAQGNTFIAGGYRGTINMGGTPLTSLGGSDIFAVKLDTKGKHVWSKSFGDMDEQHAATIGVDGAGNVTLTGRFKGTVDLGNNPLFNFNENQSLFIAQLDTSGQHKWSKAFHDTVANASTDKAGVLTLFGSYQSPVNFGGGPLAPDDNVFVARFDASGRHLWSRSFGKSSSAEQLLAPESVASSGMNHTIMAGLFSGSPNLGGGPLPKPANGGGFFLAKLRMPAP